MLAWRAPDLNQVQMESTIKKLEAELQALNSSQFSSTTAPSSSTLPLQTTIPIHMESHQPPLSPPTSTPYTDEPPTSIPSTSSPLKDKQVEDYIQWEKIIQELVATAYLKLDSLPYHLPTLPIPLLQH